MSDAVKYALWYVDTYLKTKECLPRSAEAQLLILAEEVRRLQALLEKDLIG